MFQKVYLTELPGDQSNAVGALLQPDGRLLAVTDKLCILRYPQAAAVWRRRGGRQRCRRRRDHVGADLVHQEGRGDIVKNAVGGQQDHVTVFHPKFVARKAG